MKLSETIKILETILQQQGDLPVYVWADHGQMCLTADSPGYGYVDEDGEEIDNADVDEYGEEFLTKAVIMSG